MTTKENIIQQALILFAKKGYDGVSVREIAKVVGSVTLLNNISLVKRTGTFVFLQHHSELRLGDGFKPDGSLFHLL